MIGCDEKLCWVGEWLIFGELVWVCMVMWVEDW